MTGQQLKNSILQLAIQGSLVAQDPHDEPASVLLARIRREKEQLVKAGKLKKKDLNTTPITEDEKPFDIPETWEWVNIQQITYQVGTRENQILSKGVLNEGEIRVVSQGKALIDGYSNEASKGIYDLPLVMFGDHTRNVKYIDFPFVIGADGTKFHKCILVHTKYVYYWMTLISSQLRNRGYARHYTLLKEEPIPLPPLSEQRRIVAKIEELMPLVEAYGKAQVELEALNAGLPEALKKSILQEAIQGRLVPQDPNEEPASVLLARIRREKAQLVKAGKLKKKDLDTTPITEDEKPFDIPETWEWVNIQQITYQVGTRENQILSKEVLNEGEIRVVSQGKALIDGYSNEASKGIYDLPLVMFGDHTRNVKYIDFPFVIGADGTKFHKCILVHTKYVYYWMTLISSQLRNRGYARHYTLLKEEPFPLPPLSEQRRIVSKIESLFAAIDKIKEQK